LSLGNHPAGLTTLFLTEMWERMSFYGMRGILVLFMTASLLEGGLEIDAVSASAVYGIYSSSVYLVALLGGWLADRHIGQQKAILYGGFIIMIGHFLLAFGNIEGIKLLILLFIIILVGFGASTAYLIPWSLLPDAIDQDPEKPSGIYTAWMVFIQKIGIGLSVQLLGVLLSLAGYKSSTNCSSILGVIDQPLSATITIRLCMGLIPSFLVLAG